MIAFSIYLWFIGTAMCVMLAALFQELEGGNYKMPFVIFISMFWFILLPVVFFVTLIRERSRF